MRNKYPASFYCADVNRAGLNLNAILELYKHESEVLFSFPTLVVIMQYICYAGWMARIFFYNFELKVVI